MAIENKRPTAGQLIPATETVMLQADAAKVFITRAWVVNNDAASRVVDAWHVESGGATSISNSLGPDTVVSKRRLNLTYLWNVVLMPGDSIVMQADVADQVNVQFTVQENVP